MLGGTSRPQSAPNSLKNGFVQMICHHRPTLPHFLHARSAWCWWSSPPPPRPRPGSILPDSVAGDGGETVSTADVGGSLGTIRSFEGRVFLERTIIRSSTANEPAQAAGESVAQRLRLAVILQKGRVRGSAAIA